MAANPSTIQTNAEQFKQLQRAFEGIILNSTQSLIRTFTGKTLNYLQQAWVEADESTQEAFRNWVKVQPNGEEKTRRLELYFSIIKESPEYVIVDKEDDSEDEDPFLLHLAESVGLKPGESLFGRKEVAAAPQGASSADNGSM